MTLVKLPEAFWPGSSENVAALAGVIAVDPAREVAVERVDVDLDGLPELDAPASPPRCSRLHPDPGRIDQRVDRLAGRDRAADVAHPRGHHAGQRRADRDRRVGGAGHAHLRAAPEAGSPTSCGIATTAISAGLDRPADLGARRTIRPAFSEPTWTRSPVTVALSVR